MVNYFHGFKVLKYHTYDPMSVEPIFVGQNTLNSLKLLHFGTLLLDL